MNDRIGTVCLRGADSMALAYAKRVLLYLIQVIAQCHGDIIPDTEKYGMIIFIIYKY